jgi:hypothetical protein
MSSPRGLRNNNPGNIRASADRFLGEVPSPDGEFKKFTGMEYGYRAMFVILATYLQKYGRNTIEKIVTAWAPAKENNTQAYIAAVVLYSGVAKNKPLTLASGDDYIKIVAAMSRVENGQPAESAEVAAGFGLQNKIKKQWN